MNDPQHYWTNRPDAASRVREVSLLLPDVNLHLTTDRGVFSADRIDRGTRFLLLDGPPPPGGPVDLMDLGCGYGPIACTLAPRKPEATVWPIDVNARARDLCRANAAAAGLDGVRVTTPDEVPDGLPLAGLWSNPPIRIGKKALHDLLDRWLGHLAPDGTAHLVVQRHLGADSLAKWLDARGWPTTRRGSRKGFRLLDVSGRTETSANEEGPA
ncbi:MAG: methyltransferase [Actinomycetota bacterium]|nr:methyltransferase [Actinomycetota bacterium]